MFWEKIKSITIIHRPPTSDKRLARLLESKWGIVKHNFLNLWVVLG
jgi:hypothetical protein